jgi:hypothetical protein
LTNLLPEHTHRTSRQHLLNIWRVLDCLANNDKDTLMRATKYIGMTDKALQDAIKALGVETLLWDKNFASVSQPEVVETDSNLNY